MNTRSTLLAACLIAMLSCGKSTPTSPPMSAGCTSAAGTYDVTYQGQCPSSQYLAQWTLEQTTCDVHTAVLPDLPIVSGTVRDHSVHLVMTNGFTTCLYHLEGDGQFDGQTIRAQLSGKTSGPCCGDRQETVTVVAVLRSSH